MESTASLKALYATIIFYTHTQYDDVEESETKVIKFDNWHRLANYVIATGKDIKADSYHIDIHKEPVVDVDLTNLGEPNG